MISEDAAIKQELHIEFENGGEIDNDLDFEIEPRTGTLSFDEKNEDGEDKFNVQSTEDYKFVRIINRGKIYQKTKKLIELVKNCPMLYDHRHDAYKNVLKKKRKWEQITQEIEEESVHIVKMKWKNLRDSYSKYLRTTNSSKSGNKNKGRYGKWPWVHLMAFLRPYLDVNKTQRQPSPKESVQELKFSPQIKPQLKQIEPRRVNKIIRYDNTDLIFLGYSKTLKKMSLRLQSKTKLKIARVIKEAVAQDALEKACDDKVFGSCHDDYHEIKVEAEAVNVTSMTDPLLLTD